MATKPKTLKKSPALPAKTWEYSCKKCGGGEITCEATADVSFKGSLNDGDFNGSTNNISRAVFECARCGRIDVVVHDGQDYPADEELSSVFDGGVSLDLKG